MNQIFISYKREEQPIARKLANALETNGWSVWWDPKLRVGEHFDDAIEQALAVANCVIVVWSKKSVKSQYVKDEANYALNRKKLLPVAIEEVEVPFRFARIHTEMLSDWNNIENHIGFKRLLDSIECMVRTGATEGSENAESVGEDTALSQNEYSKQNVDLGDLRCDLSISLEEAVAGVKVELTVPAQVICESCGGRGWNNHTSCPTCHSDGYVLKSKIVTVNIPAGVDSGDIIRLTGEGNVVSRDQQRGNLYISIQIKNHPIFTRYGNDLYCESPVSALFATLGGEIEIHTLEGKVKLKVPPGTEDGTLFRLRGKGIRPASGGAKGDLLCRVMI
jgi:DnaJ-class molecular chaperone